MEENLSDLGEKEILRRIERFLPSGAMNDDTAEISNYNKKLLINNDLLVEGIHFSNETISPKDIGWKAVASNLSDLAASGVEEIIGITVGLVAPRHTQWKWVEDVYEGLNQALNKFGGQLLGGDCSRGSQKILSITALGTLSKLRLHQSNALPGDLIVVSGAHGLSRLGLALLQSDPLISKVLLSNSLQEKAIISHQKPTPPCDALKELIRYKPQNLPWRAACTDSSDGLMEAVHNLSKHSHCKAIIDGSKLPRSEEWPKGSPWDDWCLNGGEDFELVLSLPKEWAEAFISKFNGSYIIGYMQTGNPEIVLKNTKNLEINSKTYFNHF